MSNSDPTTTAIQYFETDCADALIAFEKGFQQVFDRDFDSVKDVCNFAQYLCSALMTIADDRLR